jgi:hypothetical protein
MEHPDTNLQSTERANTTFSGIAESGDDTARPGCE